MFSVNHLYLEMHAFQSTLNCNDLGLLFKRASINVLYLMAEKRPSLNSKACYKVSLHSIPVQAQVTGGGKSRKATIFHWPENSQNRKSVSQEMKQVGRERTVWEQSQNKSILCDKLTVSRQKPFLGERQAWQKTLLPQP